VNGPIQVSRFIERTELERFVNDVFQQARELKGKPWARPKP